MRIVVSLIFLFLFSFSAIADQVFTLEPGAIGVKDGTTKFHMMKYDSVIEASIFGLEIKSEDTKEFIKETIFKRIEQTLNEIKDTNIEITVEVTYSHIAVFLTDKNDETFGYARAFKVVPISNRMEL